MMSSTSPPEQKPRPFPVITTARTPGSVSSAMNASRSSSYTSNGQRVEPLGPVQRDRRDAVAASSEYRNERGAIDTVTGVLR
jgi:hypothetical protein